MEEHILTALRCMQAANEHRENDRDDLARELYQKAIVLFSEKEEEYLREIASCHVSIAEIYRDENRYEIAVLHYEKAVEFHEKRVDSLPNADLIRQALYQEMKNQTVEMRRVMQRIVAHYTVKNVFGLIDTYLELGFLYKKTGAVENAALAYARAIVLMEAVALLRPDPVGDKLPVTLYVLGKLYFALQNEEQMRVCFDKALILMRRESDRFSRHIKEISGML